MSDKNNNSKELFFNTKEDAQDAWQFIAKKEKQWKNAVIGKVLN